MSRLVLSDITCISSIIINQRWLKVHKMIRKAKKNHSQSVRLNSYFYAHKQFTSPILHWQFCLTTYLNQYKRWKHLKVLPHANKKPFFKSLNAAIKQAAMSIRQTIDHKVHDTEKKSLFFWSCLMPSMSRLSWT